MELIAVENSRLLSLFLTRRLAGQPYMPDTVRALVERYRFSAFPQSLDQMKSEPIVFSHGIFAGVAIDGFNMFGDGVIISARAPTDILDEFLVDVTDWSKSALGLDRLETHSVSKMYESHVTFKTERDILKSINGFSEISKLLSAGLKKATSQSAEFDPFGIMMAVDHSVLSGLKPIAFRLERKAGLEFSMNYYSSGAPLKTKDHLAVLQKIHHRAA